MTIVRMRRMNPGKVPRWLRYRSESGSRVPFPCPLCGAEHSLHAVYWRVPVKFNDKRRVVDSGGDYCERCAVEQLGVTPRLDGHAPVTVIAGDQADGGDQ